MKIPGHIKGMMVSIRPTLPDEEPMFEREGQKEERLQRGMEQDKQRSIVNRNREIKRAKSVMGRTKDKVLKKQLKQQIKKLENENKETQRFL